MTHGCGGLVINPRASETTDIKKAPYFGAFLIGYRSTHFFAIAFSDVL